MREETSMNMGKSVAVALGCAILAGVAACIANVGNAQEVTERWLIDTPPPDSAKKTPVEAAGPMQTPSNTGDHRLPTVKNPYGPSDANAIAEGKELFVSFACSGCHGAGGGGGMCPPVINSTWVYGSDDTTLFNLIHLGSVGLRAKGYTRTGHENIVGDMPAFASILTEDQTWKLIAYIRSRFAGGASN
jgi:mono/diheme cytochrome c family protein